jgi:hypothetical protein
MNPTFFGGVFLLYLSMENSIVIGYEKRDGRMFLNLGTSNGQHVDYVELLQVITGALSMTIRIAGEKSSQTEGEVMRSVINHLESEFINSDSFKDLKTFR